jgi:hypothetical protein
MNDLADTTLYLVVVGLYLVVVNVHLSYRMPLVHVWYLYTCLSCSMPYHEQRLCLYIKFNKELKLILNYNMVVTDFENILLCILLSLITGCGSPVVALLLSIREFMSSIPTRADRVKSKMLK